MKTLTYINSQGEEIVFTNSSPFLLQKFEPTNTINIYNSKGVNQDGSKYLGNTLDIKDIPLEITIIAQSETELISYRNRILKIFNPKLQQGWLIYKNNNIEKKVECIANKIPFFSPINIMTDKCLISLTANNPFWQDTDQSKVDIALWIGDFHFPLIIPKDKGITMGHRAPSLIVNVENKGQVDTGMIIEFKAKGSLTNPSLFNVNTREFIKINKSMVAGEVIKINTNFGKKKILQDLNGVTTNILNYIDITGGGNTFLQLEPGDNLFRYDADSNLDNLEVSIYYSNNYLGV